MVLDKYKPWITALFGGGGGGGGVTFNWLMMNSSH